MLYKCYCADIVKAIDGKSFVIGSSILEVFFFISPTIAFNRMAEDLNNRYGNEMKIVNFHRVG